MSWYYEEGGRANGPVSTDEFDSLILQGRIKPMTLVWQQGMENWQSLESLDRPLPVPRESSPELDAESKEPVLSGPDAPALSPTRTCMQCGRTGFNDFILQQDKISICRDCLKSLVEEASHGFKVVSEDAAVPGQSIPSPIPARVGAYLLDLLVFLALYVALIHVTIGYDPLIEFQNAAKEVSPEEYLEANPAFRSALEKMQMIILGFAFFYHTMLTYGIGGSLGKRMLKLRVISAIDGTRISFQQTSIRFAVPVLIQLLMFALPAISFLCTILLLVGYISALYDPLRRTWFDRLAKTCVIKEV